MEGAHPFFLSSLEFSANVSLLSSSGHFGKSMLVYLLVHAREDDNVSYF